MVSSAVNRQVVGGGASSIVDAMAKALPNVAVTLIEAAVRNWIAVGGWGALREQRDDRGDDCDEREHAADRSKPECSPGQVVGRLHRALVVSAA